MCASYRPLILVSEKEFNRTGLLKSVTAPALLGYDAMFTRTDQRPTTIGMNRRGAEPGNRNAGIYTIQQLQTAACYQPS